MVSIISIPVRGVNLLRIWLGTHTSTYMLWYYLLSQYNLTSYNSPLLLIFLKIDGDTLEENTKTTKLIIQFLMINFLLISGGENRISAIFKTQWYKSGAN